MTREEIKYKLKTEGYCHFHISDFDEKYERARRVKALQDQIADERGLLKNIKEAPRYRREGAEINEEEEFYNGLR